MIFFYLKTLILLKIFLQYNTIIDNDLTRLYTDDVNIQHLISSNLSYCLNFQMITLTFNRKKMSHFRYVPLTNTFDQSMLQHCVIALMCVRCWRRLHDNHHHFGRTFAQCTRSSHCLFLRHLSVLILCQVRESCGLKSWS